MSVAELLIALMLIGLILVFSAMLRARAAWMRRLYLPGAIIGGVLALLLGPAVLGAFFTSPFEEGGGLFPGFVLESWEALPGLLINVVFATLLMGKPIPGLRKIWLRAGPQVVVGQTMAWGQYMVGLSLALLVLVPFFDMNPMAGALIEIGFEGGHGTAAGLGNTFGELGFEEGADLALGLATVGIVAGVVLGTILTNIAARRRIIVPPEEATGVKDSEQDTREAPQLTREEYQEYRKELRQASWATDPLSFHLGLVGLAIVIGWGILQGLQAVESLTWARNGGVEVMAHVPLFPLAMIGGVLVQLVVQRYGLEQQVSSRVMSRISGASLDYIIVAALATLSLTTLGEYLVPFLLLSAVGIAWPLLVLIVLAPRIIPDSWFERGIGDFGQSMGVTVTGLLLMRMADPRNESGALESFGYKQLMFEPIVGGGLFTAAALPLIAQFGALAVLIFASVLTVAWILFGLLYFGRMVPERGRGRLKPERH